MNKNIFKWINVSNFTTSNQVKIMSFLIQTFPPASLLYANNHKIQQKNMMKRKARQCYYFNFPVYNVHERCSLWDSWETNLSTSRSRNTIFLWSLMNAKIKKITAFCYIAAEVWQGWHTKIEMKHSDTEIQSTKFWYCPGYYKVKPCS